MWNTFKLQIGKLYHLKMKDREEESIGILVSKTGGHAIILQHIATLYSWNVWRLSAAMVNHYSIHVSHFQECTKITSVELPLYLYLPYKSELFQKILSEGQHALDNITYKGKLICLNQ